MIEFPCPACQYPITADERPPVKVVPCPRCGLQMLVPTPEPTDTPATDLPMPPPALEDAVQRVVGREPMSLEDIAGAVGWPPDVLLEGLLSKLCDQGKLRREDEKYRKP